MYDLCELSYNNFIENSEVWKARYKELFTPFFNKIAIKEWKTTIYSLDLPEWKCDKIWEILNDDFSCDEFKKITTNQ